MVDMTGGATPLVRDKNLKTNFPAFGGCFKQNILNYPQRPRAMYTVSQLNSVLAPP